ncbi:unnamed protein product [Amoebophrya sp. A120]|nr:unnamed protein product [Amoebophrya sp. A120]|eukprot:GSA120T00009730001.1
MSFSKLLCKLFATSIVFDQVLVQLAASASAASRFRTRRTEKHQSSLQTAPRQTKSSENENLVQQIRSTKEKVFQLQVLVRNQDDKAKSRLEELLKINTVGENSERTEDASSTSSRSSSTLSSSQAATFSFLEREIKKGSREIASAIEQEKNKIISKLDAGEELLENQMKNFQALLQKNFAREEENWHWFWLGGTNEDGTEEKGVNEKMDEILGHWKYYNDFPVEGG